ncbi:Ldh family oxidoreductase [Gryllotalpicola reticulitermitis]|uniref:Ldh family oxidoreductase n=1 Tax=Gryllotalpicola reticulitermitis TaxID=1184153 RepID=A0ABV8Q469_9MICO
MARANNVSVSEVVIDAAQLRTIVVETLVGNGATPADAEKQARILIEGDLRDQHSHGVRRLPVLVERLRRGLIVSAEEPTAEWRSDAVAVIDGHRGFGPVAAGVAISSITEKAETTGIALAAVHNSNHVGMLAPYVEDIAATGQIGIAFTTSEALVHPWGGTRAMVGTNPIGIAVPTDDEPLVVDLSTAAVSMGKVLDFAAAGRELPLGWAVDASGDATTDASAAAAGAISPFGGPKGYALGIALEVLVATLTGTALGTDVRGTLDTEEVATKGDVFLAISPRAIGGAAVLPGLAAYLASVRDSGRMPGDVSIPGDRARATRRARLEGGIPLFPGLWDRVRELHREVRVD